MFSKLIKKSNKKINTLQTFCHYIFFNKENVGNTKWQKLSRARAFSLVELMVVMAIFTIITSVTIFNYGKFSSNLIVTNLAYEAALAVREAQVYGISVKKTTAGGFNSAYGVEFNLNNPQTFYLFSDIDSDSFYNDGEKEEIFNLNGSNVVKDICVYASGRLDDPLCEEIDKVSITFKRPDPNAIIRILNNTTSNYEKVVILFTSGRGDKTAMMTVTKTGQISVSSCDTNETNPCPE